MDDPTIVTSGLSSNLYTTNEKPIDMLPAMFENFPALAPFLAITTRLGSGSTSQSKVYWEESDELPMTVILSADVAASATAITTTQYTHMRNYDLWKNTRTGGIIRVNDTTFLTDADNAVTVVNDWGTTAAAMQAGDTLIRLPSAFPENSATINPIGIVNTEFYNVTQELTRHTKTSRRVMNEATFFGAKGTKRDENNNKLQRMWKREWENGIMFSTRADTLVSGDTGYTKTLGGIYPKLYNGTNFWNVNGALTETKIDGALVDIYTKFPETNMLAAVGAPKAINYIKQIAKPLIRISPNAKEYGLNIDRYFGAIGLDLIPHPALVGPYLEEMVFIVDFQFVKQIWQETPIMEFDVVKDGGNYVVDKMYGLGTFAIANEKRHALWTGIKG